MGVLIVTEPDDSHANAIEWALGRLGIACELWVPFGSLAKTISASIGNSHESPTILRFHNISHSPDQFRSIWFRRHPTLPASEELCDEDRVFLMRELRYFYRGIKALLGLAKLIANPFIFSEHADLKAPQLLAAKEVGLTIPDTLLSNDPDEVRAFIKASPGKVIYKSHSPAAWQKNDETIALHTSIIEEKDLEGISEEYFNPGIFQRFVEKKYELRISIFGQTCIAAKIENQHDVDWRVTYNMTLTPYTLPDWVESKLLAFMAKMGLVMGMVDMIVTPDGDYVFLEVNEQGQFLWIEQMNPEIRLLQPCARFLASGDPAFCWNADEPIIVRYEDYALSDHYRKFAEEARRYSEEHKQSAWVIVEKSEGVQDIPNLG